MGGWSGEYPPCVQAKPRPPSFPGIPAGRWHPVIIPHEDAQMWLQDPVGCPFLGRGVLPPPPSQKNSGGGEGVAIIIVGGGYPPPSGTLPRARSPKKYLIGYGFFCRPACCGRSGGTPPGCPEPWHTLIRPAGSPARLRMQDRTGRSARSLWGCAYPSSGDNTGCVHSHRDDSPPRPSG